MTNPLSSQITASSLCLIRVFLVIPIIANIKYGCKHALKIIVKKTLIHNMIVLGNAPFWGMPNNMPNSEIRTFFPLILSIPPTLQPANFEIIKIIINFNQNLWTEKLLKICLITFLLCQIDQLPTYVY